MTTKEWALYYAAQGFAVLPLKPPRMPGQKKPGKEPMTAHGVLDATTNAEMINQWWDSCPDANIGIATGSRSGGLVVIDLDIDEDRGINGYEILKDWQREHGNLPDTLQSITGRGGYHIFFRDSEKHSNRAGLYDGIDIRGENGYIVAPPSLHESGRRYEWEQGPDEYQIAQADDKVKEFLSGPPSESKAVGFQMPEAIPEGQRTDTLVRLVCSQQAKGLSDEAIRAAVQAENNTRCVPPLTDEELEKTVFPALKRYQKGTAPYKAVLDKGEFRVAKQPMKFSLEKASSVIIKNPEWLIPELIPRYGITTIAGEGGVGKTSVWCEIVASITSGRNSFLLGGQVPFTSPPEDVLVLSAEDSWSYVLRARLEANGADLDRISFLSPEDERFVDLNFNGDLLKGIIEENRPSVIVFDPLQAFVPANLKMGDRNAMRKCFSPLIGYGEQYKVTSIIIAHANKQSGVWGRKRIADSSDIWDASRSVLMVGMTPDEGIRYISQEKSNYGKLSDTVLFSLDECVPTFKCYSAKRDKDFIQAEARERNIRPVVEDAKDFIIDTLRERKQIEIPELDGLAVANGISENALKNAKAVLKKDNLTHVWSVGFNPKKYFMSLKAPEKINEYVKNL